VREKFIDIDPPVNHIYENHLVAVLSADISYYASTIVGIVRGIATQVRKTALALGVEYQLSSRYLPAVYPCLLKAGLARRRRPGGVALACGIVSV